MRKYLSKLKRLRNGSWENNDFKETLFNKWQHNTKICVNYSKYTPILMVSGTVPQYPGYQGYQLLEALPVGHIYSALTDPFIFHLLFCIYCFVINYFSGVKYVQMWPFRPRNIWHLFLKYKLFSHLMSSKMVLGFSQNWIKIFFKWILIWVIWNPQETPGTDVFLQWANRTPQSFIRNVNEKVKRY